MAQQLLGKEVTKTLNEKIRTRAEALKEKGVIPTLALVRVGERPDDLSYERGAIKRCETLGVSYRKYVLPAECTQEELMSTVGEVNEDQNIHGILLFRPLPDHLDEEAVVAVMNPRKDVDGITKESLYGVFAGRKEGFPPCTAQACMEILDHYQIDCTGKRAVVIGRSQVVGKPAAMMLLKKNATVTVCHTKTEKMEEITKNADILLVAAGKKCVIDERYVSPGQILIDVGIHVNDEGKLCGDILYDAVAPVVQMITPVPGGVGGVTTSVLVGHVVEAAERMLEGKNS